VSRLGGAWLDERRRSLSVVVMHVDASVEPSEWSRQPPCTPIKQRQRRRHQQAADQHCICEHGEGGANAEDLEDDDVRVPNTPIETANSTAAEAMIRPVIETLPRIAFRGDSPRRAASRTLLSRKTP
jgi:hypothetical protein